MGDLGGTLDGFGLDFGGLLETSILAGRWFSMAFDFLGAGACCARIFLHSDSPHSVQKVTLSL